MCERPAATLRLCAHTFLFIIKNVLMAIEKTIYDIAVENARKEGESTTFSSENATVRPLEFNTIPMNTPFTIPEDYQVFKVPIRGTNSTALKVITEEGWDFWVSCITRAAKSVSLGKFIRPEGQVSKDSQNYVSLEEFFNEMLAGQKLIFTNKEKVDAMIKGEPCTINVFTIEYYDPSKHKKNNK